LSIRGDFAILSRLSPNRRHFRGVIFQPPFPKESLNIRENPLQLIAIRQRRSQPRRQSIAIHTRESANRGK
jgi:hypothetical protein